MNIRLSILLLIGCLCSSGTWMSPEEDYIVRHLPLALEQQAKFDIPASVTIAQALLESQAGQSELARRANNHFGIKCKHYWTGPVYYKKDDDRNARGKLIPSCFRKYNSVKTSYLDRSIFLSNTDHYRVLFEPSTKSPEQWAKWLSKAGYATDPRYSDKLIDLIERYDLKIYDKFNTLEFETREKGMKESFFLPAYYRRGSGF